MKKPKAAQARAVDSHAPRHQINDNGTCLRDALAYSGPEQPAFSIFASPPFPAHELDPVPDTALRVLRSLSVSLGLLETGIGKEERIMCPSAYICICIYVSYVFG